MHWMQRAPYLRFAAAAALLTGAAVLQFRVEPTVRYPVAVRDLAPGQLLDSSAVRWVDVPSGALPPPPPLERPLRVPISAGEPLTGYAFAPDPIAPPGWWAVAVPLPDQVVPGTAVRLVITGMSGATDGIVTAPPGDTDPFTAQPLGAVAVPEERAVAVAHAASRGEVTVLVPP